MSNQLNIIPIKQPTKHAQDVYRVAYWYAMQGNFGDPKREEIAERAGEDAVDRLSRPECGSDGRRVIH